MSLYAYAVYLQEREYPDEPGLTAGRVENEALLHVYATEEEAQEYADAMNLDGVGTSRISAVVVRVEVTERLWKRLWEVRA